MRTWGAVIAEAARRLRREPGLALLAVAALGVGLGANAAVFALVRGVLLKPLGYRAEARLVAVREVIPQLSRQYPSLPVNWRSFRAWREHAHAFLALALVHPAAMDATFAGAAPRRVSVDQVSANLFALLGVRPALGRTFAAGEDAPGRNHEVVLSYAFWRAAFAGAPGALGATLRLDGEPCTVVGVLPRRFYFLRGRDWGTFTAAAAAGGEPEVYQPLAIRARGQEVIGNFDWGVIGRLRRGVTVAGARAELDRITANLVATAPEPGISVVTRVTPLDRQARGGAGGSLWLLLAAVGAVLALVCANLAHLLLARAQARAPEAAVRRALGASPARLAATALAEALLLAGAGAALALGLARVALSAALALLGGRVAALPRLGDVRLGLATAGATLLAALAAGLVCGLAPALRCAGSDAADWRAAGVRFAGARAGQGIAGGRLRSALVAGEAALTTALLIVAGLLLHSFARLSAIPPGYGAAPKLILSTDLAGPDAARRAFWAALLPRLQALPGVARAALTTELPLEGTHLTQPLLVPGDARPLAQQPIANYQFVSPGYFAAMGIAVRGREFTRADERVGAPPVAVISQTAARLAWPGRNALGQTFRTAKAGPLVTVVGVARDVRTDLRRAPGPMVFEPSAEDLQRHLAYIVLRPRAGASLGPLAAAARRVVRRTQPAAVVGAARTMHQVRAGAVAPQRFELALALGFAAAALLVAGLGIYGVVAYTVECGRGELAVRAALGASRERIAVWVLRRGLAPVALGMAVGMVAAWAWSQALAAQLYAVSPHDPVSYVLAAGLVAAAALAACLGPARRAMAADPLAALRG
jgi:putative ABC transport system permease protein